MNLYKKTTIYLLTLFSGCIHNHSLLAGEKESDKEMSGDSDIKNLELKFKYKFLEKIYLKLDLNIPKTTAPETTAPETTVQEPTGSEAAAPEEAIDIFKMLSIGYKFDLSDGELFIDSGKLKSCINKKNHSFGVGVEYEKTDNIDVKARLFLSNIYNIFKGKDDEKDEYFSAEFTKNLSLKFLDKLSLSGALSGEKTIDLSFNLDHFFLKNIGFNKSNTKVVLKLQNYEIEDGKVDFGIERNISHISKKLNLEEGNFKISFGGCKEGSDLKYNLKPALIFDISDNVSLELGIDLKKDNSKNFFSSDGISYESIVKMKFEVDLS